jgi:hypothetical protein
MDDEVLKLCALVANETDTEKLLGLLHRLNEVLLTRRQALNAVGIAPMTIGLSVFPPEGKGC